MLGIVNHYSEFKQLMNEIFTSCYVMAKAHKIQKCWLVVEVCYLKYFLLV